MVRYGNTDPHVAEDDELDVEETRSSEPRLRRWRRKRRRARTEGKGDGKGESLIFASVPSRGLLQCQNEVTGVSVKAAEMSDRRRLASRREPTRPCGCSTDLEAETVREGRTCPRLPHLHGQRRPDGALVVNTDHLYSSPVSTAHARPALISLQRAPISSPRTSISGGPLRVARALLLGRSSAAMPSRQGDIIRRSGHASLRLVGRSSTLHC